MPSGTVNVIIRFHDPSKLTDLSYALFSLYAQSYEHVRPIIVLQGFTDEQQQAVGAVVDEFAWTESGRCVPLIHNVQVTEPGDYRSRLLKMAWRRGADCAGRWE